MCHEWGPLPSCMRSMRVLSSASMSVEYTTCIQWIVVSSVIGLHPIKDQFIYGYQKINQFRTETMHANSIKQHWTSSMGLSEMPLLEAGAFLFLNSLAEITCGSDSSRAGSTRIFKSGSSLENWYFNVGKKFDFRPDNFSACMMFLSIKFLMNLYYTIVCDYRTTANNQWTINPKNRKCPLWDPNLSPSSPSRSYALPVSMLRPSRSLLQDQY